MAYREGGYKGSTVAIGGILASLFFVWVIKPFASEAIDTTRMSTPAGAEVAMREDPQAGPIYAKIAEHFPADYARVRGEIAAAAATGDRDAVYAAMSKGIGDTLTANRPHLARASVEAVDRMRLAELAVVERLSTTSPAVCAHYVGTGLTAGDRLRPETEALMKAQIIAALEASADGRRHPGATARTRPTPALIRKFDAALRAEVRSDAAYSYIMDAKAAPTTRDDNRCEGARAYLMALGDLTPEERATLYVS